MPSLPNLGAKAPDFSANTTFGRMNLSDFRGQWVVLFSHPGDFTPVCTTEFLSFAKYYPQFRARNAQLIGLSIDSTPSHLAWVYNIYIHTGVEIPFPIIDDRSFKVARLYGMISPDMNETSTVRAVFIIDPNQILRTILYYPSSTGRNIPEILRILDSLQTGDAQKVVTPANWMPGMPVIMPYPQTWEQLKERVANCGKGYACMDWYLCLTPDRINQIPITQETMPISNKNQNYIEGNVVEAAAVAPVTPPTGLPQPQLPGAHCPNAGNRIVATYVYGNPQNFDPNLHDVAIWAFAEINPDSTIRVPQPQYLRQLVSYKERFPNLRVVLAIGGWGAEGFSDTAANSSRRNTFAQSIVRTINEYNLDGVDMDWEYPGVGAAGIKATPQDRANFTVLLQDVRNAIGQDKWLSVAGTGSQDYIRRSADIAAIAPIIDYFNIMAYDFTAGEPSTSRNARKHQANLFPSSLSLPGFSVDIWVRNLIAAGMPPEQLLLGIPFYGRLGASIYRTFDELRRNYINKSGFTAKWDNAAKASYLIQNSDQDFAMSYDNSLAIYYKGLYALENCLGGLFAWTSTYDQANILADAMSRAMRDPVSLKNELEGYLGYELPLTLGPENVLG